MLGRPVPGALPKNHKTDCPILISGLANAVPDYDALVPWSPGQLSLL